LTYQYIQQHHQANEGNSGLAAKSVRLWEALHRIQFKQKLSAEKWPGMHFVGNEENKKLINDYVDTESTVAVKQVHDAETPIVQEQEDMRNVEQV